MRLSRKLHLEAKGIASSAKHAAEDTMLKKNTSSNQIGYISIYSLANMMYFLSSLLISYHNFIIVIHRLDSLGYEVALEFSLKNVSVTRLELQQGHQGAWKEVC